MVVINLLKPTPWEWDPFHTWNDRQYPISWTKANCLLVYSLFLLFPFTSMELYSCTNSALIIRFQLVGFSRHIALSLVGSVVLPRTIFWYVYPALILILIFCSSSVLVRLKARLLVWIRENLSELDQPANGEPQLAAEVVLDISHGEEVLPFPEATDDFYPVGL
ncbi:hypothetical protein TIFTF001_035485 [Ficus carica]|uniref:Transmembrane protein n=1 Tax=Ficus carica TaxID=3494 RepID=A0AA88E5Q2_FICCA|nr:hypothetical protein TIFTF001_035485 [Ficus carica]